MAEASEWTVEWYTTRSGERPAKAFLDALTDERHTKDSLVLLTLIRRWGNQLPRDKSAQVEPGLLELRGHQIRIFYVFRPGRRVIVLDAEVKKQDKIPQDVLRRVRARRLDLEAQEAEAQAKTKRRKK